MKRREFIATTASFGVFALGFGLFNACDGGVKKVDLKLDEGVANKGGDSVLSDNQQTEQQIWNEQVKQAQSKDLSEQNPNLNTQNLTQNEGQNFAQNAENSTSHPQNLAKEQKNSQNQGQIPQNTAHSANPSKTYYTLNGKELRSNSSGVKMAFARLNNGIEMPMVGLGTHALTGAAGQRAMENAFGAGYRHFDTAQMYGNELELGRAYAISRLPRNEVFITTKLSSDMSFEETLKSFDASLARLGVDYVDLLLLHSPYSSANSMYRAMQTILKDGKARAIGISNFSAAAYIEFIKTCKVIPAVNQCQMHIFQQQRTLRATLHKHGTLLESWSPFVAGSKEFFEHKTLRLIADKHGKSVAQVALRFIAELGIPVIPKSASLERQRENIDIFSFTLDDNDRELLSKLDRAKSAFGWTSV